MSEHEPPDGFWIEVDGQAAHVLGDPNMDEETADALQELVRAAVRWIESKDFPESKVKMSEPPKIPNRDSVSVAYVKNSAHFHGEVLTHEDHHHVYACIYRGEGYDDPVSAVPFVGAASAANWVDSTLERLEAEYT